jgi:4'-phosphopantetheinyl transferase EntD
VSGGGWVVGVGGSYNKAKGRGKHDKYRFVRCARKRRQQHAHSLCVVQMVLAMLLGARTPARAVRLQHVPVALAEGWSQPAFSTVFSESLSHGHCVLVQLPQKEQVGEDYRLPGEVRPDLHARELAHMRDYKPARSVFFAGGRLALRRALWAMEAPGLEPMLPGKNGAPVIPGQFVGSISHTHGLAAALVSRRPPGEEGEDEHMAVGIDVERTSRPTSLRLARKILAAEEERQLGLHLGLDEQQDLTLRFSLKEALYKAIHPLLEQPIAWHSVLVRPRPRSTVKNSSSWQRQHWPAAARGALGACARRPSGLHWASEQSAALFMVPPKGTRTEQQRFPAAPLPTCRPPGHPDPDGSCELQLDELEQKTGVRLSVEARWRMQNGFFLTTATARMQETGE